MKSDDEWCDDRLPCPPDLAARRARSEATRRPAARANPARDVGRAGPQAGQVGRDSLRSHRGWHSFAPRDGPSSRPDGERPSSPSGGRRTGRRLRRGRPPAAAGGRRGQRRATQRPRRYRRREVRGDAENTPHSKRSGSFSFGILKLSFGYVMTTLPVRSISKGQLQTSKIDAHSSL